MRFASLQLVPRYQSLFSERVESQLNGCFAEYLNAEIVLRTIVDTSMALRWLQSTFLYVRVRPPRCPSAGLCTQTGYLITLLTNGSLIGSPSPSAVWTGAEWIMWRCGPTDAEKARGGKY